MQLEILHTPSPQPRTGMPPLLFVHGAYTHAACWQIHFLPWLAAQGLTAYAVSLPGHGNSPDANQLQQYGLADYVHAVQHAMRQLPALPVLIGHSLGGAIVQNILCHAPAAGVVLMNSVPPYGTLPATYRVAGQQPQLWWQLQQNLWMSGQQGSLNTLRDALFGPDLSDAEISAYYPLLQAESMRALWDLSVLGWMPQAPLHKQPALVLAGACDALFSAADARACATRLHTHVTTLPRLGHAMMLDAGWQSAAQALLDWMEHNFS